MKRSILMVAVLGMLMPVVANAEYINNPPWAGTPGLETYQGWEFTSDLSPKTVNNAYGTPTITSDYGYEEWRDTFEDRQGMLFFDGYEDYINIEIPNADNGNPRKEIWLQIVYFAHDGFPGMDYYIEGSGGESTGFAGPGIAPQVLDSTANGDWVYEAIHWFIEPNPVSETITLGSSFWEDMYIDQLHIDTICIPEPASLALLAMGGMAMLRRRR